MNWLQVDDYSGGGWTRTADSLARATHYCSELEKGAILVFSAPPFELPGHDVDFLVSLNTRESRFHKNISYRPGEDLLRGFGDPANRPALHGVMRRFATEARKFAANFLLPYTGSFQMDYASFRPLEEKGRNLPVHRRNALLHVDAFPTRPTCGARILRVFTNINPVNNREWVVADCFEQLAAQFVEERPIPAFSVRSGVVRGFKRSLSSLGLPVRDRSPYDEFMLQFHDWIKENRDFQTNVEGKQRRRFSPLATWMVFTDGLPHAAVSGQFVIEQTFLIPVESLVVPASSPIRLLEKIVGQSLN